MTTFELAKLAVTTLEEKKATDTLILNVESLTTLGDFFIITTGNNSTQVRSLAEEVEFVLGKKGGKHPKRVERDTSGSWILLDFGDLIVHVFHYQARETYRLEGVWADAAKYTPEQFLNMKESEL